MGTTDPKTAFTEKMQGLIRDAHAEADRLEGKIDQARAEARAEHQQHVAAVRSKVAATEAKLQQFQNADAARFTQAKADVERSWNDAKLSIEEAAARLKK